ncbi:MAG: DUF3025 domain-containing protein [Polyangiaceae bacterium]
MSSFDVSAFGRRPYRDFHPRLLSALEGFTTWPAPEQYDELVRQVPQAPDIHLPRFVSEDRRAVRRAGGYERHVAALRAVPTRPGHWHDFFNMSVWAHFPKVRWALNALHVDPSVGPKDPRNGRAPAQNLAATFDEAGMLVVSSSTQVLAALRALHFKRAFWELREEVLATTRFWLVGHGMLESLLTPHTALAARSLFVQVTELPDAAANDTFRYQIDALAAARIEGWRSERNVLDPVPLLAIPGFCDNDSAGFYDDPRNVHFEPISRRPAALSDAIAE